MYNKKEKQREWYLKNRERILQKKRDTYSYTLEDKEKGRQYYLKNKERYKKSNRIGTLKEYGITHVEYEEMFSTQNGCCAICGKSFKHTGHVDHNHVTGKVRALLCNVCNTQVGVYEKYKDKFEEYLLRYPQ